jgi:hypothetical protein
VALHEKLLVAKQLADDGDRSRIVDYLQGINDTSTGIHTLYLYCDYRRTNDLTALSLYGALARQLLSRLDEVPSQLSEMIQEACVKLHRPSARIDEVRQVFRFLEPHYKRLFICVDALDECTVAPKLLDFCKEIPGKASYIFIGRQSTSRLIKRAFPDVVVHNIPPQRDDVSVLIRERITTEREWQPDLLPEVLAIDIHREVLKLANGM